VEISDHLKALRFGLNKFEMLILHGMLEWLKLNKSEDFFLCKSPNNPVNVPEDEWKVFLESEDSAKI